MKGPRARYKFAVARYWQCPHCGKRATTPGDVTTLPCDCRPPDAPALMHLCEPARKPRTVPDDRPPPPPA